MSHRIPSLTFLAGITFFAASTASFAQTQAPSIPAPAQQSSTAASQSNDSASFTTSQGQVTINSTMGQAPSTASPPSFEQLSGGKKYITKEQANAYPPLANDFLYAAGPNGKRISKAQYEHWVKDLN